MPDYTFDFKRTSGFSEDLPTDLQETILQAHQTMHAPNKNHLYSFNNFGLENYMPALEIPLSLTLQNISTSARLVCNAARATGNVFAEAQSWNALVSHSFLRYQSSPTDNFTLNIQHINRNINAGFDAIDRWKDDQVRLKTLEPFLSVAAHHKLRVMRTKTQGENTITVFTNIINTTFLTKLLGALPIIYPLWRETLLKEGNEDLKQTFKALFEDSAEDFIEHLLSTIDSIVKREKERKLQQLYDLSKTFTNAERIRKNKEINNIEDNLQNSQSSLERILRDIKEQEERRRVLLYEITQLQIVPTEPDLSYMTLFENEIVTLNNVDTYRNRIYITVKTPITNYAKSDMEMYFKRPESNFVTSRPWVADLLKKTFIDRQAELIFTTTVGMPYTASASWDVNVHNWGKDTGNFHIVSFNCFATAKAEIAQLLKNGNFSMALNQFVATCASFSLADSAVLGRFIDHIAHLDNDGHNRAIFRNKITDEMFTPAQYKNLYEEKENLE